MSSYQRLIIAPVLLLAGALVFPQVLTAGQTLASGSLVSYYVVPRASSPVTVDGNLDEFAWQSAEQINGFERILNDYDLVLNPTRAKMVWDDRNLYVGFVCLDPDAWAISTNEDDPLWEEEVVEVFIDPDGDGENYLELEVNPLNVVVDLKIHQLHPEWKASIEWDIAGLQNAVRVQGTVNDSLSRDLGWTAEIAIPWTAMAGQIGGADRPKPGDTWRLNLYRIERGGGRNLKLQIDALNRQAGPLRRQIEALAKGGAKEKKKLQAALEPIEQQLKPLQERYEQQTEYTAWSETFQRGFHHPARFGVVQFGE
jgi:hypothetical protein